MAIMREDLVDAFLTHNVHGNAINQAVLLVWTPLIKRQSGDKGFMRLHDYFDAGILKNVPHQSARQPSRVITVARDSSQEFTQYIFCSYK
jgi:hypothetical protein